MRLLVAEKTVQQTDTYNTAVNVPTTRTFDDGGVTKRIDPGNPDGSCLFFRMSSRSGINNQMSPDQMPPIDSEVVDSVGVAAIQAWIQEL
jgi:hypothetical protein